MLQGRVGIARTTRICALVLNLPLVTTLCRAVMRMSGRQVTKRQML